MSDILIRGMEMPKGGYRTIEIGFDADGHPMALADGGDAFDVISTADVRPVARGKWVNYGDEYRPDIKCCICGQRKPILLGNFNFNFCPNCGADMSAEEDE